MRIHKTQAIVLRRRKYSESSLVITFLTRDLGRISCVAKGSRRLKSPFGDGLSLFAMSEIIYYFRPYRSLQIVVESDLEWFPWSTRGNPVRFLYASVFSEILLSAVSGPAPDRALFELVLAGIRAVDRSGATGLPAVLWSLELKLLSILGYRPNLDGCSACGSRKVSGPVYLDPAAGGLACGEHRRADRDAQPLSAGSVRLLERLLTLPVAQAARHRAGAVMRGEIDKAIASFLNYHLGVVPNGSVTALLADLEAGAARRGTRRGRS